MTYTAFMRLLSDAADCATYDQYVAEVGGSLPGEFYDDGVAAGDKVELINAALKYTWEYAHDKSIAKIYELSGLRMHTELMRLIGLPIRTGEDWFGGARTPPPYVMDTIAFAVLGIVLYPDEV